MSVKAKENQISFRVEDEINEQIEKYADVEQVSVADFVRTCFRYGFQKYQTLPGGLFALEGERRAAVLARQAEVNSEVAGNAGRKKKAS